MSWCRVSWGCDISFANGVRDSFDYVVCATGYRPRLERLPYRLADDLAQALGTCDGYPRLSLFSESTVPKLFFIGSLGIQRFGPQVNFIFGTEFVVPRLLARVTAHLEGKSLCDPDLRVEAQADNG